jgi:hypothetical protein
MPIFSIPGQPKLYFWSEKYIIWQPCHNVPNFASLGKKLSQTYSNEDLI